MGRDYSKLQNGSDIRGCAIALDPSDKVNLDAETVRRLAKGFLYLISQQYGKNPADVVISIGRDSRITGEALLNSATEGISSCGAAVFDAGLASTPAMFMSTVFPEYDCDGAIMITASHMPSNRNGMKFFSKEGGLDKGDIIDIINFAESDQILARLTPMGEQTPHGEIKKIDLIDTYSSHLRNIISSGCSDFAVDKDKPLAGLRITVDAGNGAGGFYASKVLEPLGADVSSSQFLEPDGMFPNHIPNPENKIAITSICDKVKASAADLGLIFDTDVDRASAVDETGAEISRNGIVALASVLVAESYPGSTVVTDSVTSLGLKKFLESDLGLKHLRFKRGYRNVINKGIELNDAGEVCGLAIETSGHAAFKDNYFLDDGAYLATLIVIHTARLAASGEKISCVLENMEIPAESKEVRLPVSGEGFAATGDAAIEALRSAVKNGEIKGSSLEEPNYEGVRVLFGASDEPTGWLLLRKSLHEPIMPLNMESNLSGGVKEIIDSILPVLQQFEDIDVSELM